MISVAQQEPTAPPQPDIASPTEAMEYLTTIFRIERQDPRLKVQAAKGIVNYHLASEIAGLINALAEQTERVQAILANSPIGVQPQPGPGE